MEQTTATTTTKSDKYNIYYYSINNSDFIVVDKNNLVGHLTKTR